MKKRFQNALLLITIFFTHFAQAQQIQDYYGSWTNNDTAFLDITADSVFYYEFNNGCYTEIVSPYTVLSDSTIQINVNGQSVPLTLNLSSNDSVLTVVSPADTAVFYLNSFDINDYLPCPDSSITDSSYIGQWKVTTPTLMYLEFTSDSVFIYRFDSVICYAVNYLTCSYQGNSQLLISGVITTTYSLSDNGDSMNVNMVGLGDLQLNRLPFSLDSLEECTYDWKCNVNSGCENVGLNEGTFNSEQDCQASCTPDTSGSDTTSINEYDLNVSIYPNPFSDYTILSLSSNVVRYQLIDLTGRLVYNKLVENQVEYLHKNQLKSGVYMLHLIGKKGSNFERLLIE